MDILRRKISRDMSSSDLTLLIFGIIAFMYFTGEILKPLALSVLLSFALTPATRLFERLGLPRAGAVVLTVVIVLGLVGGIGYVVGQQVASLANRLPDYQENIETKLRGVIKSGQRLNVMVDQVTARLEKPRPDRPGELAPIQKVQVVEQRSFQDRLRSASGPYLEYLGIGGFVLVLVLFMLVGREDLRDRIVGLFGHHQVGITTRTMEEIGRRISRYLATLALVNSGFGLVIGVGLTLIGLPYAVLWGCLAAMLRFIPYVGTAVALCCRWSSRSRISPAGSSHWRSSPSSERSSWPSTASSSPSSTARRRESPRSGCSSPPCFGPGFGERPASSSRPH